MIEKLKEVFFPSYYRTFNPIDYKESIAILNSNSKNYLDRYKTLMKINHPDNGGSPYICMKINEAKNFLTEDRKELFELDKFFRKR